MVTTLPRSSLLEKVGDSSISPHSRMGMLKQYIEEEQITNIAPILRLFLRLNGLPFSLEQHYQFEPLYSTEFVREVVLQMARQLGKTTTEGALGVAHCGMIGPKPFRVMYVTPLFDQVRRISNDQVRPFIETSPLRTTWTGTTGEKSVLRRVFRNQAMMTFTYAYLSADRIRGASIDEIFFDEAQDMNPDHVPIIVSTMAASDYKLMKVAGTPKGSATCLSMEWHSSSQAEWVIPCYACKHQNIPSSEFDLDRMIGPWRKDISPTRPGTICAKCSKVIYPQHGAWVHRYKEKSRYCAGYHLPQPVAFIHYSKPAAWADILSAREGRQGFTPTKYKNEVLAEEAGGGAEMITVPELQKAANLKIPNRPLRPYDTARSLAVDRYKTKIVSSDWGGGGDDGESRTAMVLLGITRQNKIEVVWGRRLPNPHDHFGEAEAALDLFRMFGCKLIGHDYTGAGGLRDTLLVNSGIPLEQIMAINYVRAAKSKLMRYIKATEAHNRAHYNLDKARAMLHVLHGIRTGLISFFNYDYESKEEPGLIRDFLALREIKTESASGFETYSIGRQPGFSDDFAQAVMIGCSVLWHVHRCWPRFDIPEKYEITSQHLAQEAREWEEGVDYST
jgi:hypothetical protein